MNQTHNAHPDRRSPGRIAKAVVAAALSLCGTVHAQSASGAFGVTVLLRTFSETVTSDHRCTHRGQAKDRETLRISCPATVDVQAVSKAAAGWTLQHQRLNGEPYQDRYQLIAGAGKMPTSAVPMELTISW